MSVPDIQTLRQCLSFLPFEELDLQFLDHRVHKFFAKTAIQTILSAQLCQWDSLRRIQSEVNGHQEVQNTLTLNSISASQISRTMEKIPTSVCEALFYRTVSQFQDTSTDQRVKGLRLALVDSTNLRLPPALGDWAYVTRHRSGVKIHTKIAITSAGDTYPEHILPSTGNVSDHEAADILVADEGVLYVMDRGYICYKRMDGWINRKLDFVIRMNETHKVQVVEEYDRDPNDPAILLDAKVAVGSAFRTMECPIRIVEFKDEKGRTYRIGTTRMDLTAREVADVYRQRWLIELFFKWIKQHLKTAKLYSYKPLSVWNHIYLALTAYALVLLVKLKTATQKTVWEVLIQFRVHWRDNWEKFVSSLHPIPKRESKGRQKVDKPQPLLTAEKQEAALVKPPKCRKK